MREQVGKSDKAAPIRAAGVERGRQTRKRSFLNRCANGRATPRHADP